MTKEKVQELIELTKWEMKYKPLNDKQIDLLEKSLVKLEELLRRVS